MTPEQERAIDQAADELFASWGPLHYPREVLDEVALLLQPTRSGTGGTSHPTGGAGTGPGRAA